MRRWPVRWEVTTPARSRGCRCLVVCGWRASASWARTPTERGRSANRLTSRQRAGSASAVRSASMGRSILKENIRVKE